MNLDHDSYGILASFDSEDQLVRAVRGIKAAGFREIDAYSPEPVEELDHVLPTHSRLIPMAAVVGAVLGALAGYLLQYYAASIAYPLDIGGRPLNSVPAFMQVTFEMAVLGSALATFISLLMSERLPRLHHPIFEADDFTRASQDRFFVFVSSRDRQFNSERVSALLSRLDADQISEVMLQ